MRWIKCRLIWSIIGVDLKQEVKIFFIRFIAFSMLPESISDFMKNHELWQKEDFITLSQERGKVLAILNNNTKDLDFLSKNRLIYML